MYALDKYTSQTRIVSFLDYEKPLNQIDSG